MKEQQPVSVLTSSLVEESLLLQRESRAKLVSALVRYILESEREEARQKRVRRVGS